MSLPRFSIIVPYFNRAAMLPDCVASVRAQTVTDWELLLVDDGSTDGSPEVVSHLTREDERIRGLTRPEDRTKGANASRNVGYAAARGRYVLFLDSDDGLLPTALERHLALLEGTGKCASVTWAVNQHGRLLNKVREQPTDASALDWLIDKRVKWPINALCWRRECLPERPFHEELMAGQDFEFHVRMVKQLGMDAFTIEGVQTATIDSGDHQRISQANRNRSHYQYVKARVELLPVFADDPSRQRRLLENVEEYYPELLEDYPTEDALLVSYRDNFRTLVGREPRTVVPPPPPPPGWWKRFRRSVRHRFSKLFS